MDMATDLRSRMAAHRLGVAYVADLLGRSRKQVSAYRTGDAPIPLKVALVLNRHEPKLLSDEAILGRLRGDAPAPSETSAA